MKLQKRESLLLVAIVAAMAAVFGFDLSIELGVASAVLYVGVIWIAFWGRDRRWIWTAAASCCLLTILGYGLSPAGGETWKVLLNRAAALVVIGGTAVLCDFAKRAQQRLQQSERELSRRFERRTAELERSQVELQFAYAAVTGEHESLSNTSAIVRETGDDLEAIADFDQLLDTWARQLRTVIGAHQSAVSYFPRGIIAEGKHAISLSDKYAKYRSYDVLPSGEGIWNLVINQKLSFCFSDKELKSHPAWKNFSDMRDERGLEHPPMRGWLAVPVLGRQHEFVGMLQLSDKHEGDFTQDDLQRVQRLGQLMAPAFSLQYSNEELEFRNKDLLNAKEQLETSNLDLQQFAYIASHDLQTPLRAIAGFAQFLHKDYSGQLDEKADDYIERIVEGAKRMQQLISDLLSYSRVDSQVAPLQPVDLNEVFADALELLQASIQDTGAELTREELPTVVGDRAQLSQLLQNLIGNGIKYHGDEPPRVKVSAEQNSARWTIAVRDNGIGIDPKHREKIFEIFRRLHTQDTYPGTGIGLAVCRRIVHRHGGRIWLESETGKGSVFYFTIPASIPEQL